MALENGAAGWFGRKLVIVGTAAVVSAADVTPAVAVKPIAGARGSVHVRRHDRWEARVSQGAKCLTIVSEKQSQML